MITLGKGDKVRVVRTGGSSNFMLYSLYKDEVGTVVGRHSVVQHWVIVEFPDPSSDPEPVPIEELELVSAVDQLAELTQP